MPDLRIEDVADQQTFCDIDVAFYRSAGNVKKSSYSDAKQCALEVRSCVDGSV
jgi:hypothetical protein